MYFLIFIIIGVLFGFLTMKMARKRNRDPINGFIFGFFFPAVAMVYYWLIGNSEIKIKAEGSMCSVEEPNKKKKYEDVLHKNLHPAVFIILILFSLILIAVIYFGLIRPNIQKSKGPVVGEEEILPPIEKPWKKFTPRDYDFRILLPADPTVSDIPTEDNDWIVDQKIFESKGEKSFYYVFIRKWSSDKYNSYLLLEEFLGIGDEKELVSKNLTTFTLFNNYYTAMDYVTRDRDKEIGFYYYSRGRLIFAGEVLYNLSVDYIEGNFNETDYNKFINSFQLIK